MLDAFVDRMLASVAAGEAPTPVGLTVLVRVYAATRRDDIGVALEQSLGGAVAGTRAETTGERAEWLRLYAEASRLSDDPRLRDAAEVTAAALAAPSQQSGDVADQAAALDALLAACDCVDAHRFAPPAIDQLERLVAADYHPGEGLRGRTAAEAVAVALALLSAFDVSGRLAYPMLAEELMRAVRDQLATAAPPTCCAAARVLGRLALLHEDDGYRATAVVAPAADYAADRRRLLAAAAPRCASPADMAAYALALTEWHERS